MSEIKIYYTSTGPYKVDTAQLSDAEIEQLNELASTGMMVDEDIVTVLKDHPGSYKLVTDPRELRDPDGGSYEEPPYERIDMDLNALILMCQRATGAANHELRHLYLTLALDQRELFMAQAEVEYNKEKAAAEANYAAAIASACAEIIGGGISVGFGAGAFHELRKSQIQAKSANKASDEVLTKKAELVTNGKESSIAITDMETKIAKTTKTRDRFESESKTTEKYIADTKAQLAVKEAELKQAEAAEAAKQKKVNGADNAVVSKEQDFKAVHKAKDDADAEVVKAQQARDAANADADAKYIEQDKAQENLALIKDDRPAGTEQKDIEAAETKELACKQKLAGAEQEVAAKKQKLQEAEAAQDAAGSELENVTKRFNDKAEEIDSAEREARERSYFDKDGIGSTKIDRDQINSLKSELNDLEIELDTKNRTWGETVKAKTQAKEELNTAKSDFADSEKEYLAAKDATTDLKSKKQNYDDSVSGAQADFYAKRAEFNRASGDSMKSEQDLAHAKSNSSIPTLKRDVAVLKDKVFIGEEKLKFQETEKSKADDRITELKKEIKDRESQRISFKQKTDLEIDGLQASATKDMHLSDMMIKKSNAISQLGTGISQIVSGLIKIGAANFTHHGAELSAEAKLEHAKGELANMMYQQLMDFANTARDCINDMRNMQSTTAQSTQQLLSSIARNMA